MKKFKNIIANIKDIIIRMILPYLSEKTKFSFIYRYKFWKYSQNAEYSASGAGSDINATIKIRSGLESFFKEFNIKSIIDIPCGDFNWFGKINLENYKYIGCDLVEEVITNNNLKFNNNKNISFTTFDLINDDIKKFDNYDFLIIRDCLVHLDNKDVHKILKKIFSSKIKYIGLTSYDIENNDIKPQKGDRWRPINFLLKPYLLDTPFYIIDDSNSFNNTENLKKLLIWKNENSNIYSK